MQIDGLLLLDKPVGITSNHALQRVKRLFKAKKAGHTGSLDPLASGLLPICFGQGTKYSQYLLDANKRYEVSVYFGAKTTTGDAEGDIVQEYDTSSLTKERISEALIDFQGQIQQIPPMYSAVKHQGKPLYLLARQGKTIDRKSRTVTIYENKLHSLKGTSASFSVHCSKGTYIRTLMEDIGDKLGVGAYVSALRRTSVGHFDGHQYYSLEMLEAQANKDVLELHKLLLPVDEALTHWPKLILTDDALDVLYYGQKVQLNDIPSPKWVRLYDKIEQFIGIGEILDNGWLAPRRLMMKNTSNAGKIVHQTVE